MAKILIVASNYGFWGEELQAPWDILKQAGHDLVLATPQGKKPLPLKISVDPDFVDPIQKYHVNPADVCARTKELVLSKEWNFPIPLTKATMNDYETLVLAGGLGADLDLINNPAVHRLILESVYANKLTCSMCFAVGALAFTRDPQNSYKSVIYGKKITVHPRDWDFTDWAGYELWNATENNKGTDFLSPGFTVPQQDIVEDAVGPCGNVLADPTTSREKPSVVYDWPFITACSVESAIAYGNTIAQIISLREAQGFM
jgi:putative intracellular protease/amidase